MSSVGPAVGSAAHFANASTRDDGYPRRRFVSQPARLCEVFDTGLRRERRLAGAHFSIADMATFPWLWRHPRMFRIDTGGMDGLNRWLAEVSGRPGLRKVHARYKEMVAIDRDDIAAIDADLRDRILGRGRWTLPRET